MSLADLYEKIAAEDVEEQYEETSEIEKLAEEYDAAGRIMARGFMDELDKLAQAAGPPVALQQQAAAGQKARAARTPSPKPQWRGAKAPTTGTVTMGTPKITR